MEFPKSGGPAGAGMAGSNGGIASGPSPRHSSISEAIPDEVAAEKLKRTNGRLARCEFFGQGQHHVAIGLTQFCQRVFELEHEARIFTRFTGFHNKLFKRLFG